MTFEKHFGTIFLALCGTLGGILILLAWLGLIPIDPDVVLLWEPIPGRTDMAGCDYPAALVTKTGLVLCNKPPFSGGGSSVETITDLDTGKIVWQQYGRPLRQGKPCYLPGAEKVNIVNMSGNICKETVTQPSR